MVAAIAELERYRDTAGRRWTYIPTGRHTISHQKEPMSKNFQLLMRAEQEVSSGSGKKRHQVLWTPPAEVHAVPSCPLDGVDERSRDQVAKLVRQLFLLPGAVRAVAFAAVEPGNGCSWMAVQCARILASQVGGAVCIIDANLHSPSLHRYFGIGNYRGFSDVMSHPGR